MVRLRHSRHDIQAIHINFTIYMKLNELNYNGRLNYTNHNQVDGIRDAFCFQW